MNDFHENLQAKEVAIKAGYDLITSQLDQISEDLDTTPLPVSNSVTPEAAVTSIQTEIMDRYRQLHRSDETARTKFALLAPSTPHSYAEIVELGMNTLGHYLQETMPLITEAEVPLSTLAHPNSLKVIASMMRANLERDEFQTAIANSRDNIRVSSHENDTYLEVIPNSFLDYFLKAMDPDKSDTITANHTQLMSRIVSVIPPEEKDNQRIWSMASSLGSIFLYNPELFQSEINSQHMHQNLNFSLPANKLTEDEETKLAIKESSDFELFARIKTNSPLAEWLFPNGMPENPIDRYEQSLAKLFGTVSYTRTRFCPAGRSLMQLFSGKTPEHNITVTYINRFISLLGSTST